MSLELSTLSGGISLTFPLAIQGSPLCSLSIFPDTTADRGVRVAIQLAVNNFEQDATSYQTRFGEGWEEKLARDAEEYLRRGGGMLVIAWIWNQVRKLNDSHSI